MIKKNVLKQYYDEKEDYLCKMCQKSCFLVNADFLCFYCSVFDTRKLEIVLAERKQIEEKQKEYKRYYKVFNQY